MAEDWELKQLERRVDSLEKGLERAREEEQRRWNRRMGLAAAVYWTFYVVALTTWVVLAATGHLHHH